MSEPGVYDHVVSLGYDCRLAYNLRRAFGFERAYPLDWWVTPLPALIAFLRDPSVERLYDPRHLEPFRVERGIFAIRNVHYDIELHHEFPRGDDGMVTPDWREHIGQARSRTDYLMGRLLGLGPGSRMLFARSTKRAEGRELGARFAPLIGEVREALASLFPQLGAQLLLIDPVQEVKAKGVMNLWVRDPNRSNWRGTPELWTDRLLGAGIAWAGASAGSRVEASPEADHLRSGEMGEK